MSGGHGGHGGGHGRRRHHEEEHEEHGNHEAWVIPYADVLTLLMALFLVLWALGNPDKKKTEVAAESFRNAIGNVGGIDLGPTGASLTGGAGDSVLDGGGLAMVDESDEAVRPEGGDGAAAGAADTIPWDDPLVVAADPLTRVEQAVRTTAIGSGLTTVVGSRREERGLVVTIVSDRVLFTAGEVAIQPEGTDILKVIAASLRGLPNAIVVEGHTDPSPISTPRFPSNWELSTARATSVVRFLIGSGIDPRRISAAGYADTRPIAKGSSAAARAKNRRVEIVVLDTT
jgi:chemotaxis protein MotB